MAALFLVYRNKPEARQSDGVHSFLVDAADGDTAKSDAGVGAGFEAVEIAAVAALPDGRTVIKIEGDAISMLGLSRGGNAVA